MTAQDDSARSQRFKTPPFDHSPDAGDGCVAMIR
jgi:hypothetical protein